MVKKWKQPQNGSISHDAAISLAESKIFGAELSGNAPIVDLHGLDTQSGIHDLDTFLHSAFMNGEEVVKIIHGRGTGKMREAVQVFLSTHPVIEMFRDAQNPGESSGVTYVVLKKRE